jgi:hypothetical protein
MVWTLNGRHTYRDGIIQQKVVACNNCINETHKHATFNLTTKSALFWQVCDNSQTIDNYRPTCCFSPPIKYRIICI